MVHPGCHIKCISDNGVACRRSRDLSDKRTSKGVHKGDILIVDEVCDDWVRYRDSWLPLYIGDVPKFEMLDGADLGAGICKQGPSLWNSSYIASELPAAVKEMSHSELPDAVKEMSRSSPAMALPCTCAADEISKSSPAALRSEEPHVMTPRKAWDMIRAEAELFEQDLLIQRQASSSETWPLSPRMQEAAELMRQTQSAPNVSQAARPHSHSSFGALQRNLPHGHVETSVECHVHREDELMPSVRGPSALGFAPTQGPIVEHVQEVGRGTECRLTVRLSLRSEIHTSQSLSIGEAPGTSACSSAIQASPSPHTVVDNRATLHEGWVYKRSRHLGVWRRRWMVLEPSGLIRCFSDDTSSREATSEFRIPNGTADLHRRSDGVLALNVRCKSRKLQCLLKFRKVCGLQHLSDTIRTVLVFDAGAAGNDEWSQALAKTFARPSPTWHASGSGMPSVREANLTGDSGTLGYI
jgi:hypothetical protein